MKRKKLANAKRKRIFSDLEDALIRGKLIEKGIFVFLKQIQNYSQEEYLRNKCVYGAAERFLHFTIECILDIANHIIF